MIRKILLIGWFCIGADSVAQSQVPFTVGNIVIYRVGDGSTALTTTARPIFLDEYTPSGTLVQSVAMPTATSGGNFAMTAQGTAFMGWLTRSANGEYLVAPGFNATPNTAVSGTSSATIPRVVGLINYNASINTTTALTDYANAGQPLSAFSSDGTKIWVTGSTGGVRYATTGATTSIQLATTPTNLRVPAISNNQLYVSIPAGGVATTGTGLPETAGQTITVLPGLPISGSSLYQYAFADLDAGVAGPDVLYIADGTNGLLKYSLVAGTWTANGSSGTGTDLYRGLTIVQNGSSVTLYSTRLSNQLVSLVDASGYNGTITATPTLLATAGVNTAFRGVALAPEGPGVQVSVKTYLQGAYNVGLGRHKDVTAGWSAVLNTHALSQPYNSVAFGNYAGTESVASGFFTSTAGTTDIVDWVLVELRDATTPSTVVARRAAFIREDGVVVDTDGTPDVSFPGVSGGNYYLVVRHRNHLGMRSASAVTLASGSATLYDFSTAITQAYDDAAVTTNDAMKDMSGVFCMWGGNVNANTTVRASGSPVQNDYLELYNTILGGIVGTVLSNVYSPGDINMDGSARASGGPTQNDRLILANDILLGVIGTVITQHL